MNRVTDDINHAKKTILTGGLLVYPTEAVWGVGCDYRNENAMMRLLETKQRDVSKGVILIASHIQQILPLIQLNDQNDLARALKTWPGHNTWVFKASPSVPRWITGSHDTVAVRVTAHPAVRPLCDALNMAIVSTSANRAGQSTATTIAEAQQQLGDAVDCYWDQALGTQNQPSSIRMASTGAVLR